MPDISYQMARRYENKKHLAWVRQHPCLMCPASPSDAHHLMKPWSGYRGMGMKAGDENVIPLCHAHHMQLHDFQGSEFKFFGMVFGDEDFGQTTARSLWLRSPYYERGSNAELRGK